MKKNILFICIENSNRSQMAQAFAILYGRDKVNAFSAGSRPSGKINPDAITAMKEVGYDLNSHHSKAIDELSESSYEYVVTMGCGDQCPFVNAKYHEDWNIPDPRGMKDSDFRKVRDLIKKKVQELLGKI